MAHGSTRTDLERVSDYREFDFRQNQPGEFLVEIKELMVALTLIAFLCMRVIKRLDNFH
jgi:hypothetical protein